MAGNRDLSRRACEGRGDARILLKALQDTDARGASRFPLLRGPKIGLMWVRMLAYPGRAAITPIEIIPVAVDVQVRKVTEYLGVATTRGQDLEKVRRHGTEGFRPGPGAVVLREVGMYDSSESP